MHLIHNDGVGDWSEINEAGPKHQAVTAEDIKRVANRYFTKENRNVAIYTRKQLCDRKTEDGGRRAEDGGWRTVGRGRKTEDG